MRSPRSTPIVSCGCLKISFLFFATVIVFFTAGLLSLVLRARRLLGAYRIPMETGLLIPSDKFYKRRSQEKTRFQRPDVFLLSSPFYKRRSQEKTRFQRPDVFLLSSPCN